MNLPGHQIAGSNQRARCTQSRILVLLAVGYQWSYNGANFVAFKIDGDAVHPLLLASMRFAIIGTHLLPAGVASVFGSAAPLFLALFSWIVLREPLGLWQVYGDGLGFTGLVLMAWFTSHSGRFSPLGAALTLAASGCWAGGSLWARRLRLPADPIVTLVTQLVAAATVLIILARASGVADQTDLAHLPASAWWAVAFLVIASTLIGNAVFPAVNHDVSPTDRQHLQLCLSSGRAAAAAVGGPIGGTTDIAEAVCRWGCIVGRGPHGAWFICWQEGTSQEYD